MSDEQLTPEEATALEAMESEPPVTQEEPKQEESSPQNGTTEESRADPPVEFKSTRSEEKPPEGFVPHQAMHAERVKRQELERKLADLEASIPQQEAEPAPEWVDPLADPEGHRRWNEYNLQRVQAQVEQQQKAIQEQAEQRQMWHAVGQAEAEFQQRQSDYPAAVQHLRNTRSQELMALGMAPHEIEAQMSKDATAIYQAAQNLGMNPAELAYMRARSAGYEAQTAPQATAQPAPQAQVSDAAKVAALAATQENVGGINNSGAPQSGGLTMEAVAEMSEAEIAKLSEDELRKVMGG